MLCFWPVSEVQFGIKFDHLDDAKTVEYQKQDSIFKKILGEILRLECLSEWKADSKKFLNEKILIPWNVNSKWHG